MYIFHTESISCGLGVGNLGVANNIDYTNFSLDVHCSDLKAKLQANARLLMWANSLSHTLPSYADSYPSELWGYNGNPVKTPKYIFKYMIKLLYSCLMDTAHGIPQWWTWPNLQLKLTADHFVHKLISCDVSESASSHICYWPIACWEWLTEFR